MPLSTKEIRINAVSFKTAKSLSQDLEAIDLPDEFISASLRENRNFGSEYNEFSRKAAVAISYQFARKFSNEARVETDTLHQSVWFLYWTELCNIIPVRSVLRNSRKQFYKKTVLIALNSNKLTIFEEWRENSDILPLIIYFELKKIGANPLLVFPPEQDTSGLTIVINNGIIETQLLVGDGIVFCPKATRGADKAVPLIWNTPNSTKRINKLLLSLQNLPPPCVQIKLQAHSVNFGSAEITLHQSSLTWPHYSDLVRREFMKILQLTHQTIEQLAIKYSLFEAIICDHLFVDTALIAGCIRSRGGKVKLWPHSASMRLTMHHKVAPKEIVRVRRDKEIKHPSFQSTKKIIRSELMFKPPSKICDTVDGEKQNIVLIGGATKLNQMPLFDIMGHENTVKAFLTGLSNRLSNVNVYVRPKGYWSPFGWFQNLADFTLIEAKDPPSQISLPNMTFVCITQTSTALIEGVGRGVPGIIIKEINASDYFPLEESLFPQMKVEEALETIDSFKDQDNYKIYWERQSEWFNKNASFNSCR